LDHIESPFNIGCQRQYALDSISTINFARGVVLIDVKFKIIRRAEGLQHKRRARNAERSKLARGAIPPVSTVKRQLVEIQMTSTTDLFRRLNSVVGIQASKTAYSIININRVIGGPAAKQRGSSYISLVSKNLCRVPSRALRGAQRAVLRAIISSHDKLRNYGDLN
jgi:hypothetical protein